MLIEILYLYYLILTLKKFQTIHVHELGGLVHFSSTRRGDFNTLVESLLFFFNTYPFKQFILYQYPNLFFSGMNPLLCSLSFSALHFSNSHCLPVSLLLLFLCFFHSPGQGENSRKKLQSSQSVFCSSYFDSE